MTRGVRSAEGQVMSGYTKEEIRRVTSAYDFSATLTAAMEIHPMMRRALRRDVATPEDYVHAAAIVAMKYRFAAFAGWPFQLEWMKKYLTAEFPKKQMVVNFPYGTDPLDVALGQMKWGLDRGAEEIDSVVPVQFAQSGDFAAVGRYAKALQDAARPYGVQVKSIIRIGDLMKTEDDARTLSKVIGAAKAVATAGGAFVKTCTGFADGKATVRIVSAIKEAVAGTPTKVKASGGITCIGDALALLDAGADRLAGKWPIVLELEALGV
jgi:deoxyribose-phosphate aldolase